MYAFDGKNNILFHFPTFGYCLISVMTPVNPKLTSVSHLLFQFQRALKTMVFPSHVFCRVVLVVDRGAEGSFVIFSKKNAMRVWPSHSLSCWRGGGDRLHIGGVGFTFYPFAEFVSKRERSRAQKPLSGPRWHMMATDEEKCCTHVPVRVSVVR